MFDGFLAATKAELKSPFLKQRIKRKLVQIQTAPSFQSSAPTDLLLTPHPQGSDVTRDGQRLLINMPAAEGAPNPMTLVLNWTSGLRK